MTPLSSGYYECIGNMIKRYPGKGLYATRCFYIDAESVLMWISPRVEDLETPSRSARQFYYDCPIQFAGVTVARASYEKLGGFRPDLVHTADVEMWARVVTSDAGIVINEVKANYRIFSQNDTGRLAAKGENVRDLCRLNEVFASRYPDFSIALAKQKAAERALQQYKQFKALGETESARINHILWRELTSFRRRVLTYARESAFLRRVAGNTPPNPKSE